MKYSIGSLEYADNPLVLFRGIVGSRAYGTQNANSDTDGNLASAAFPGETLSFAHDADGLLVSASNSVGVVSNAYDAATGWLMASWGADGTAVEYCMDSPIGIIDPMGNDAYISGSSGHATMWVDEPGENGKVAIFDFGLATGGWNDYNRNLIYGKGKTVATRSNKKDSMGRYDVRIVTSEATDRAIIDCMEQYKKEDHDYSFLFNNCAQAVRAVLIRSGVDDIEWCVWPEGLVESIRNRGGSYEPYNVFSHNPYFCPLR